MTDTSKDRRIAQLEWANANMRASLQRLRCWAERDPIGPAEANGVAQWVRRVIDYALEIGDTEKLPDVTA